MVAMGAAGAAVEYMLASPNEGPGGAAAAGGFWAIGASESLLLSLSLSLSLLLSAFAGGNDDIGCFGGGSCW